MNTGLTTTDVRALALDPAAPSPLDAGTHLGGVFKWTAGLCTLTVGKAGSGTGRVTSNPEGSDCGADCSEEYTCGTATAVALTATADAGASFTGWSGDCSDARACVVSMDATRRVTATFTLNSYLLSVTRAGSADGTVSSDLAGIGCGADCSESFPQGTTLTLTASPPTGATFKEWRGDACNGSTNPTCPVTMTGAKTITAIFSKVFTDSTLTVRTTQVKAAHLSELREAVNTLRSRWSLDASGWTDPTLIVPSSFVKTRHVAELRTALNEAYTAAKRTPPTYTDPTLKARVTPIRASHLSELRAAVQALE